MVLKAPAKPCQVALRKESVDRNVAGQVAIQEIRKSLSARRAWIEMSRGQPHRCGSWRVALRKESVDRNLVGAGSLSTLGVALRKESVDRNDTVQIVVVIMHVALRKESVDRNITRRQLPTPEPRRSPQGERG